MVGFLFGAITMAGFVVLMSHLNLAWH